jgi:hypothetical protein
VEGTPVALELRSGPHDGERSIACVATHLPWQAAINDLCFAQQAKAQGRLLEVPYTTVQDYIYMLQQVCLASAPGRQAVMLLLASAVSDFYVKDMVRGVNRDCDVGANLYAYADGGVLHVSAIK